MAGKRLRDTALWDKPWFTALSPAEKCAWDYMTDKCDNVGVYYVNATIANTHIGEEVDWQSLPEKCNGNIVVLSDSKWWLIDFCSFQHPDLDPTSKSKPIMSYIRDLKKHGLWDGDNRCPKGMDTLCHAVQGKERQGKVRQGEEDPFGNMKWKRGSGA